MDAVQIHLKIGGKKTKTKICTFDRVTDYKNVIII